MHRIRHTRHRRRWIAGGLVGILLLLLGTTGVALNHQKKKVAGCRAKAVCISPSSGPQDTQVTLTYPASAQVPSQGTFLVDFQDDSDNGQVFPSQSIAEGKSSKGRGIFKGVVPWEPCLAPYKNKKRPIQLRVYATGSDGKPLAGIAPGIFKLKCKEPKFSATTSVAPASVFADGKASSTVTTTTAVAYTTADGQQHQDPTTAVVIAFATTLGVLSATSVPTDSSGIATTTITSTDAGVATITPTATTAVPAPTALQTGAVHFTPRIDGLAENFDDAASTTFVSVKTTPDASKLKFTWTLQLPPGPACGALVPSNTADSGYAHPGCDPLTYEPFVQLTVVATDAAGDSATCTVYARRHEGQGMVSPPPCT